MSKKTFNHERMEAENQSLLAYSEPDCPPPASQEPHSFNSSGTAQITESSSSSQTDYMTGTGTTHSEDLIGIFTDQADNCSSTRGIPCHQTPLTSDHFQDANTDPESLLPIGSGWQAVTDDSFQHGNQIFSQTRSQIT